MLDHFQHDLAYALRGIRRKPGFALAVITTLALGIGANTAMFGIVDRLLFRPPALLRDAEQTHRVYLAQTYRDSELINQVMAHARFTDLATSTTSFETVAAHSLRRLAVGVGESAREMSIGAVSANFFALFDAPPAIGRYFDAAEDRPPAGAPVAVISHAMWQTQFASRPDALGSALQIGPTSYTIIGVAPQAFTGLWDDTPPAAFIPITSYAGGTDFRSTSRTWWQTYGWSWMFVVARRKANVTVEQASADLSIAFAQSLDNQRVEQPSMPAKSEIRSYALAGSILTNRGPNVSNVARVATWVGGVSVIVLLIACANVASLLLARALGRRREIALRLALGVSRTRLLSQLLTESLVLALLGGATGLVVAHWGGAALRAGLLDAATSSSTWGDPRTILFAIAAALAVGLLTGLAPALQAVRANLAEDLKSGARAGTYTRSRARVALFVLQGALSVVLLVGAGLFVRSLTNVLAVRLGYDVDAVLLVETNMRGTQLNDAETMSLRLRLLEAARAIPVVQHASLQNAVPFYSTRSRSLHVQGIDTVAKLGSFNLNAVSSDYFHTLGTRIVRGRAISDMDTDRSAKVVVVSEAMGQVLWPGRNALGQCLRIGTGGGRERLDPATVSCTTVVGVAENIKEQSLSADAGYYYYVPAAQFNPTHGGLFVRTRGDANVLRETVRRGLQSVMPGMTYVTITPLRDIIGTQRRSWQLGATMFLAFGVLALIIAGVGLYSVIAYNVTQRTHEIGVRVALGAQAGDVAGLIVASGLRLTLAGVALGAVASVWAGRWVRGLLFEVSPTDPVVFGVVAATLIAVAVVASWLPARRAARVDPNVVLRSD